MDAVAPSIDRAFCSEWLSLFFAPKELVSLFPKLSIKPYGSSIPNRSLEFPSEWALFTDDLEPNGLVFLPQVFERLTSFSNSSSEWFLKKFHLVLYSLTCFRQNQWKFSKSFGDLGALYFASSEQLSTSQVFTDDSKSLGHVHPWVDVKHCKD